jgi:[acyl-carrier-protein] S-malonyltransferase
LELAEEFGCRAVELKVAGAFHSPLMAPAGQRLHNTLAETSIKRPRVPVVANVTADYHGDPESIRESLEQQLTRPVLWQRSIERLIQDGYDRFVEVGPGRVLTGLMRKINRSVETVNVSRIEHLDAVMTVDSPG